MNQQELYDQIKSGDLLEGRFYDGKVKSKYGFEISCEPSRAINGDSVAVELIQGEWKNEVKAGLQEVDEELEENFIQDVEETEALKR